MSTSYNEQEHEARRAYRDSEARAYAQDTSTRTIGQLVADATQDVSSIIRNEIQLAKSEVKTDVTRAGKGIGMFVGAALFGFLALIYLLHSLAWGLMQLGLMGWLAYLITALLLLVVAGVLALLGKKAVTNLNVMPERTIRNAQETVEALKPAKPTSTGSATNTTGSATTTGSTTYTASTTSTGYATGTADGATRADV